MSPATPAAGSSPPPGYPKWFQYDALFQRYAGRVPWGWLKAIAMVETSLGTDPRYLAGSVSFDGKSKGLMQLILKTAHALDPSITTLEQLNDDETSVRLAGALLNQLYDQMGGVPEAVFRAYNGGPRYGAATLPYWEKIQGFLALIDQYQPGIT